MKVAGRKTIMTASITPLTNEAPPVPFCSTGVAGDFVAAGVSAAAAAAGTPSKTAIPQNPSEPSGKSSVQKVQETVAKSARAMERTAFGARRSEIRVRRFIRMTAKMGLVPIEPHPFQTRKFPKPVLNDGSPGIFRTALNGGIGSLLRFELRFGLYERELSHKLGSAVGKHDRHVLNEGFAVIDERVEQELVMGVERSERRREAFDEHEVGPRVGFAVFLFEVLLEELFGLVVVEILIGSGESGLNRFNSRGRIGNGGLKFRALGRKGLEVSSRRFVAVFQLVGEAFQGCLAIGRLVKNPIHVGLEDVKVFACGHHVARDDLFPPLPLVGQNRRDGHHVVIKADGSFGLCLFGKSDVERKRYGRITQIGHGFSLEFDVVSVGVRLASGRSRTVRDVGEIDEERKKYPEKENPADEVLDFGA